MIRTHHLLLAILITLGLSAAAQADLNQHTVKGESLYYIGKDNKLFGTDGQYSGMLIFRRSFMDGTSKIVVVRVLGKPHAEYGLSPLSGYQPYMLRSVIAFSAKLSMGAKYAPADDAWILDKQSWVTATRGTGFTYVDAKTQASGKVVSLTLRGTGYEGMNKGTQLSKSLVGWFVVKPETGKAAMVYVPDLGASRVLFLYSLLTHPERVVLFDMDSSFISPSGVSTSLWTATSSAALDY